MSDLTLDTFFNAPQAAVAIPELPSLIAFFPADLVGAAFGDGALVFSGVRLIFPAPLERVQLICLWWLPVGKYLLDAGITESNGTLRAGARSVQDTNERIVHLTRHLLRFEVPLEAGTYQAVARLNEQVIIEQRIEVVR